MEGGVMPAHDVIAEDLRKRIVLGSLKPGEPLPEEDIATRHGVSRVPVREALRRLEAEGYVRTVRFQGARVAIPSRTMVLELMQIRRPLEAMAARLAARVNGAPVMPRLRKVTERGVRAAEKQERGHHLDLVDEFHQLVARASGNHELEELLGQLRNKVRWVFAMDLEHRATHAWADHQAIFEAVVAGDEEKAERLMSEHVLADERWYLAKVYDTGTGS